MTDATTGLHVRWMIRRDFPQAIALPGHGWDEAELLAHTRRRDTIGMAAESPADGRVVGWMVYRLTDRRVRLVQLAGPPAAATALAAKLAGKLDPARRRAAHGWVDLSHAAACVAAGGHVLRVAGDDALVIWRAAPEGRR